MLYWTGIEKDYATSIVSPVVDLAFPLDWSVSAIAGKQVLCSGSLKLLEERLHETRRAIEGSKKLTGGKW